MAASARPWRAPAGEAWWVRPAMIAVAGVAALLFAAHIGSSEFVPYYSAAARSMTGSWSAFLYGSVDPAGTIMLDKTPGFLWPQALAARLLGFHAWALALPQALEGLVAVGALFLAVRRWAGAAAGVLAAAIFTLTPVIASLFGKAMEDGALIMCLVVAAWALTRAVESARLGWLLLAALWVGAGFQAKMLMAWVVLPAFAAVYLLAAPVSLPRRLGHLALAGAATLAVSISWLALVALTPPGDRPYVDGTTTNDVFGMVFGYNGASRFGILHLRGAITPNFGALPGAATAWWKLLDAHLATQVGWLYPLAAAAVGLGLWERRGRDRTDPERAGVLLWGLWLAVTAVAYSAGTILHTTYMAALAPPVAALAGYGITRLTRPGRLGALAATAAVTLVWAAWLDSRGPAFLPWLVPAALAAAVLGLALAVTRRGPAAAGAALLVVAMLAAPAGWAASALDPLSDGNVLDASAGPPGFFDLIAPPVAAASRAEIEGVPYGGASIGEGPPDPRQRQVLGYLEAHRAGATYLVATESVALTTLYIRESGQPVLLVGGFSGLTPYPTLAGFQRLVATGRLRYVLEPAGGGTATTRDRIAAWVLANCQPVPGPDGRVLAAQGGALYSCDPSLSSP